MSSPPRSCPFVGALVVLFGALTGPIHDLSDYYLFSAHMVQHMLLVFAMPPLLLYGTPGLDAAPAPAATPRSCGSAARLTRPTRRLRDLQRDRSWPGTCRRSTTWPWSSTRSTSSRHLMIMAGCRDPVVAGAVPARRAAARPYPVQMLYLFVVGLPDGDGGHLHLDGRQPALPVLRGGAADLASSSPRAPTSTWAGSSCGSPGAWSSSSRSRVVFFRWQSAGGDDAARDPWPVRAMAARLAWAAVVAVFFADDARQRGERHRLRARRALTGRSATARLIPPLRLDVLIEYSHRLAALAATVLIVATTVLTLRGTARAGAPAPRAGCCPSCSRCRSRSAASRCCCSCPT